MSIQQQAETRRERRVAIISGISNLAIQYNFSAIAIALAFMDNGDADRSAAYPRTDEQSSYLKSLVFAGAIVGQFTMGLAGDVLGRRNAMLLTNSFSALGALGSALCTWGPPSSLYLIMGACRFLLGVGVGGKYPLAATMSREASSSTVSEHVSTESVPLTGGAPVSSIKVARGFFWQTPGAMLPYVVALLLLSVIGKDQYGAEHMLTTSVCFRLLLGLGAVPTLAAMALTYSTAESDEYRAASADARNPLRVVRAHPELLGRLTGCGFSWALYDFVYYGTSFNQVIITDAVFGSGESLFDNCWQNIVLTAMGLPGVVLGIAALYRWPSRKLQVCGFWLMAGTCVALAVAVKIGAPNGVKFGVFCALLFALNWGPNVSTYCLPAEVFPTAVRSTCFGLCAAMGKLGALVGSASFEAITKAVGLDGVYFVCAGVTLIGLLVTVTMVPRPGKADDATREVAPMARPIIDSP